MDDRTNTIFGWILFAAIIALGFSIASNMYFHADKPERPEQLGYVIEGAEEVGGDAGEMSIAEAMTMPGVDASKGETVFQKCVQCHTINQGGANGIGPNLYATMGKAIGGHAGFAYSSALSEKGGTWDWDNMSAWLKSPRAFASGTKMSFAGLSKVEDRAAIMLYMNENGSNLPVPEFVAAAAAEGEGDVDGAGEGQGAVEGSDPSAVEAAGAMGSAQPVPANGSGGTTAN